MLYLLAAVAHGLEFQGLRKMLEWGRSHLREEVWKMFQVCLPNTANTTVSRQGNKTYLITGDIPAMWFRDSYNQIQPYIDFVRDDPELRATVLGLVRYQAHLMGLDPYPNAYYSKPNTHKPYSDRSTRRAFNRKVTVNPGLVHQRKFQVDSIAFFIKLVNQFYERDKNIELVDASLLRAFRSISLLARAQMVDKMLQQKGQVMHYTFTRQGFPNELQGGVGPAGGTCGLLRSGFRPSDDPVLLPYNIAANALLATQLKTLVFGLLADFSEARPAYIGLTQQLRISFTKIYQSIQSNLKVKGTTTLKGRLIYAQETDCLGKYQLGDDPNLPSLMSMPIYGSTTTHDPIWQNTRLFLYSQDNPFFFKSRDGRIEGLGSTHTSGGFIWPLGILTRIIVSSDPEQIAFCFGMLAMQGPLMHQSFHIEDPKAITRVWFAWANSMFAVAVMKVARGPYRGAVLKPDSF